ncbi:MAG: thylakoid-anchored PsbP-like protein [Monoraphidium minutum]|nr:MAG: thylakoid-anchored PsbP-like protein [Monoraphidium minutum]
MLRFTPACQCSNVARRERRMFRHCVQLRAMPDQEPAAPPPPPPPAAGQQSRITLSDPAQTVIAGGRMPSKRRLLVGGATAAAVALGGNLGGVTSGLLALDGGAAAGRLRLDVLVPVRGLKRCVDAANGFEFQYPAAWLGDQTLARRAAQRAEAARALDPPALRGGDAERTERRRARAALDPVAAFGPAGGTGEENVSVICGPIAPGFLLESLGPPASAAQRFLDTTAAPPGSGYTGTLLEASQRRDDAGVLYYQFEFGIEKAPPAPFMRRNVSVLAARGDVLYTFNAQCPAAAWGRDGHLLRAAAASFRLTAAPPPRRRQQF